tara:strand:- start:4894 stop:5385 length:492 start_codon:yes stop_codon:yes gene_type:complete
MKLVFPCEENHLKYELHRLCEMFVPEYDPSELNVRVGKGKYSYAALAFLDTKELVIYPAYHYRHPDDLKSTLLHEVGHFAYCDDPDHGPGFKMYYDLLSERQKEIDEEVVPSSYKDFLYARPVRANRYEYICSFCDEIFFRKKRVSLKCSKCHLEMDEKAIVS